MSGYMYIPSSLPVTQLYGPALSWSPIQVGRRTIINKLFFDLAQEEEDVLDAEFLKVPRIDLFLLNPKPSESSVSAPARGGYLDCGSGVLEWGLGSDDETVIGKVHCEPSTWESRAVPTRGWSTSPKVPSPCKGSTAVLPSPLCCLNS